MTNIQFQTRAIDAQGCVANAWNVITNKFWMYIGVGILTVILIGLIPVLNIFLFGPVMGGFFYLVLRDMRGEPVEFGMMFKGFEKFVPLMLAGIVQSIPGIIYQAIQFASDVSKIAGSVSNGGVSGDLFQSEPTGAAAASVSLLTGIVILGFGLLGVAWNLAFSFAIPLIVEHDLRVGDALKTSINAAVENVGGLLLLVLIESGVAILGMLAFCLGIFVAIPVIYAANAFAYRMVFPLGQTEFDAPYTTFGSGE
jgi:hypothetical protein